jgi:hypothetical protein
MSYPQTIKLIAQDGAGEAVKDAQDAAWEVALPTGDFSFFGSRSELKKRIRVVDAVFDESNRSSEKEMPMCAACMAPIVDAEQAGTQFCKACAIGEKGDQE